MVGSKPRKCLPVMIPTSKDHERWWDINRRLSPEDQKWKEEWEIVNKANKSAIKGIYSNNIA